MNLWFRLLWALISWRSRSRINMHDVGVRSFRVWPTDLDIFNHMNNGKYGALMDLGRLDGGHYTPQLSDVSLAELLQEVMLHFGGLAKRKGLTLEGRAEWSKPLQTLGMGLNGVLTAIMVPVLAAWMPHCSHLGFRARQV